MAKVKQVLLNVGRNALEIQFRLTNPRVSYNGREVGKMKDGFKKSVISFTEEEDGDQVEYTVQSGNFDSTVLLVSRNGEVLLRLT
ncbi:MAG: hypothetical protein AAF196_20750 [Planctomycetota bacterium]